MLTQFKTRLTRKLSTPLAQNTMWALGGYGMRLFIQAAYFIIIARCLGPTQYGGFIATTALTAVLSPFVGLGCGSLLIKNVARDRRVFPDYWGNGLFMTVVSGLASVALVIGVCTVLLPKGIPLQVIVCVCISDLIFVKLLDVAAWAFQSFEMFSQNAQLNVLISMARLTGIGALALAVHRPTVAAWTAVYLAGSVVAACVGVVWVTARLGKPKLALHRIRGESAEGFCFAASLSSQTIYNDIDKTMVARLSTLEAAGIYAAAYRLIDVAFIPVRALLNAAYPTYFRRGVDGIQATLKYGRHLLLLTLPYPLFAFAAIMFGARFVPYVLGREYAHASEALQWLAVIPLLKTLQFFIADALTGAGHQGYRTLAQASVAVFNVLVNFWVIPAYGWRGAAWSSLASDGLLTVALWSVAAGLLMRQSNTRQMVKVLSEDPC